MVLSRSLSLPLAASAVLFLAAACGDEDAPSTSAAGSAGKASAGASAGGKAGASAAGRSGANASGAGGANASGAGGANASGAGGANTGGAGGANTSGAGGANTSGAGGANAGGANVGGANASGAGGASAGAGGVASGGMGPAGAAGSPSGGAGGGGGMAGAGGAPVPEPCPRVQVHVAAGAKLNVRSEPSTKGTVAAQLDDGAIVDVLGEVKGEMINGTDAWFHIQSGALQGYVFGQYATCTEEKPPVVTAPDGFYLPLVCGKSAKIAQGNGGSFSHSGKSYYAFDFSLALNTPMTAMADGVVKYLYDKTGPGDPCYNGGPDTCFPYANYVVVKHGDGTMTTYKHLNRVDVKLGQTIKRGTVVGLSGSTGYSTGPHAHVMRMNDCGVYQCLSIPLQFQDVPGDHVPNQGQTVTSGNCP